jgi:hypothetical protein
LHEQILFDLSNAFFDLSIQFSFTLLYFLHIFTFQILQF